MRNIRLRSFLLRTDMVAEKVASFLGAASYDTKEGSGIELIEEESALFVFKYHEQNEFVDVVTDFYGERQKNSYLQYTSFKFYLFPVSDGLFQLFIESPPKGLKQFVSTLRRALPQPFSFDAMRLDVYLWYKKLSSRADITRVRALKAQSSLINIDGESSFRLAVESSSNAISKMESMVDGEKLYLERLKVSFYLGNAERVVELSTLFNITVSGWAALESILFLISLRLD